MVIKVGYLQIHWKRSEKCATIFLNFRSDYRNFNLIYPTMKNLLVVLTLILFLGLSCKKTSPEPYGPTYIRIQNLTDLAMSNVSVNTYDTTFNYGTIAKQSYTDYHRFSRAYYAKVNISAYINGVRYKTDTVFNYSYQAYLGQMKATYSVWSDVPGHLLFTCTPESAIK
jgi:hypothetical protein